MSHSAKLCAPSQNPPQSPPPSLLSELAIHRTEKVFNFQRWRVYFSQLHLTTTRYQLPQLLPDCLLCAASEKTFFAIFEFISLSPRTFCHPLRLTNIIYGLMCRCSLIFRGETFTIAGRREREILSFHELLLIQLAFKCSHCDRRVNETRFLCTRTSSEISKCEVLTSTLSRPKHLCMFCP